jgi:rhodanese-related sulfurtransferase
MRRVFLLTLLALIVLGAFVIVALRYSARETLASAPSAPRFVEAPLPHAHVADLRRSLPFAVAVEGEFPGVRQLPPFELSARLETDSVFLLDVREQVEFDVSHLERAERVDPSARAADVLGHLGPRAGGAAIVFYCSVGQRSSRMAARTQADLAGRGARAVYNLRGGIFAWHNEERALVNALGPTRYVHPYNSSWGRLLERPEHAATRVS